MSLVTSPPRPSAMADLFDVRLLLLASAVVLVGLGLVSLVLPGLGQPTAEWRRMLAMLRSAPAAPRLGLGRAATLADIDALALSLPSLGGLSRRVREDLAAQARVYVAPGGTTIVRQGEASDAAYFLIDGRTVASRQAEDGAERVPEVHNAGDFFGEIGALTSVPRTASVLQVPTAALRKMMSDTQLNRVFLSKMTERMANEHGRSAVLRRAGPGGAA